MPQPEAQVAKDFGVAVLSSAIPLLLEVGVNHVSANTMSAYYESV